MDVKNLIIRLSGFDRDAVVTVGENIGWSNIESVIEDGSCVKILMSDNVVFSDDGAANRNKPPRDKLQAKIAVIATALDNLGHGGGDGERLHQFYALVSELRQLSAVQ